MKKMMFLVAALMFSAAVFAQKNTTRPEAPLAAETNKLVEKYGLDLAQTQRMDKIVATKAQNLADIEHLKSEKPEVYRAKKLSVLTGARASEAHVLTTKAQKEIYRQMLVELRTRRAEKEAELKKQNAPKAAIEQALLEIEAEY